MNQANVKANTVKKIAVLVHNDVMSDARVRKEARSLAQAGHAVHVFGYSTKSNDYPTTLDGGINLKIETRAIRSFPARVVLKLVSRWLSLCGSKVKAGLLVAGIFVLTSLFALSFFDSVSESSPAFVVVVILSGLLLMAIVFISFFRNQYLADWVKIHGGYGRIARILASNVMGSDYDAVHCHDIIAMMAGEIIKKKNPRICLIWDAHELYTELGYKAHYARKFIDQLIARIAPRVDRMITISQSFIDHYSSQYPKLPKAELVMNATLRPQTNRMDQTLLREAAGLDAEQRVLLFQGGLSQDRGIDLLLEAAPKLPNKWTVVFMGRGPLEVNIKKAADAANVGRSKGAPCIALIPPAPHEVLRDWTSGADLGIIPYENSSKNHLYCTPNKLWEYPNSRVPILATDLVEMGQIITTNGIGALLPRDFSSGDIIAAIEMISDAQLEEWRVNCDRFNERENWEKYEPNLHRVYL